MKEAQSLYVSLGFKPTAAYRLDREIPRAIWGQKHPAVYSYRDGRGWDNPSPSGVADRWVRRTWYQLTDDAAFVALA